MDTFLVATFITVVVAYNILAFIQIRLNKRVSLLIEDYNKAIEQVEENHKEINIYCLTHILEESIKEENYERAKKCQDLIELMKTNEELKKSN